MAGGIDCPDFPNVASVPAGHLPLLANARSKAKDVFAQQTWQVLGMSKETWARKCKSFV